MPLLLASTFQHFKQLDAFKNSLKSWKVACITTAALTQIDDNPERPAWVIGEIDAIRNLAGEFFEYDLRGKKIDDLKTDLSHCDLIYFIGGNTFCLLEIINKSGFREFSKKYISEGRSIWGGSAGAIVHCPDINYITCMDDPKKANLESTKALMNTHLYILPHWNGKHQAEALECLKTNSALPIVCLTDEQAIYIDGNKIEIL